jgi:hypothetical protein
MTFRVETRDGTVLIVDQEDLRLVTAYLLLRGYPPVNIEAVDAQPSDPHDALL